MDFGVINTSVPKEWFSFFLTFLFFLHLVGINVLFGWVVILLTEEIKNKPQIPEFLSTKMPSILALAINLGVGSLLFLQVLWGSFFYTSSILIAPFWLAIVLVVILLYYLLYVYDFKFKKFSISLRKLILGIIFICLVYVSFVFVINTTLMLNPEDWTQFYLKQINIFEMQDATLIPKYLHFFLASLALGGLGLSFYGSKKGSVDSQIGLRWFLGATLLQLIVGTWFLFSLPNEVLFSILANKKALIFFSIAILLIFISILSVLRKQLLTLTYSTLGIVLFMVLFRREVRLAYLSRYIGEEYFVSHNVYSPLILFLAVLSLSLFLLFILIKKSFKSREG